VDAARYRLLMRSVRHLVRTSIQVADTILLNKTDITAEEEVDKIERDIRALMKQGAELERISAKSGLSAAVLERLCAHDTARI
jgi:G3E family GTPase